MQHLQVISIAFDIQTDNDIENTNYSTFLISTHPYKPCLPERREFVGVGVVKLDCYLPWIWNQLRDMLVGM